MTARSMATVLGTLETPAYQELRPGEPNRFSGFVLALGCDPVARLEAVAGRGSVHSVPATLPSPDLAEHLPHVPAAAHCRFSFELDAADDLTLAAVSSSGDRSAFLRYPVRAVRARARRLQDLVGRLRSVPAPTPELVFATQGGRDVGSYTRSVIPGVWNLQAYLREAGVESPVEAVLDFGCGTGRLLLGWWLDDPDRRLVGCDLRSDLVRWGQDHLPHPIEVVRNDLHPPLPFEDGAFDLIQAVSVFTHLSLASQRRWLEEMLRLLVPGGHLLITLHGPTYIDLLGGDDAMAEFEAAGYLERDLDAEGANGFATYHGPDFARRLFEGFRQVASFPRGQPQDPCIVTPPAMFQDVYVVQKA